MKRGSSVQQTNESSPGGGGGAFSLWPCSITKLCLTFVTLWTVAYKTPLSSGFPRQEY